MATESIFGIQNNKKHQINLANLVFFTTSNHPFTLLLLINYFPTPMGKMGVGLGFMRGEYRYMDRITHIAPPRNCLFGTKSKYAQQSTVDVMMLKPAAKPFRMLSAYFITTATNRPPNACKRITLATSTLYPKCVGWTPMQRESWWKTFRKS